MAAITIISEYWQQKEHLVGAVFMLLFTAGVIFVLAAFRRKQKRCSAETEASFETIMFLAQKVDELGLHSVMTIEGTDHRIAETIIQSTQSRDQQILTMDSMQAVAAEDLEAGTTYLSLMEGNLEVLKEALK